MHEIRINVDTKEGFHPPKVVIQKDGRTLIDMPADELVARLEALQKHLDTCLGTSEGRPECRGTCPSCGNYVPPGYYPCDGNGSHPSVVTPSLRY